MMGKPGPDELLEEEQQDSKDRIAAENIQSKVSDEIVKPEDIQISGIDQKEDESKIIKDVVPEENAGLQNDLENESLLEGKVDR